MATPYQLKNGNWIDLETINHISSSYFDIFKKEEIRKGYVTVMHSWTREDVIVEPPEKAEEYRDHLGKLWTEATAKPRPHNVRMTPEGEPVSSDFAVNKMMEGKIRFVPDENKGDTLRIPPLLSCSYCGWNTYDHEIGDRCGRTSSKPGMQDCPGTYQLAEQGK